MCVCYCINIKLLYTVSGYLEALSFFCSAKIFFQLNFKAILTRSNIQLAKMCKDSCVRLNAVYEKQLKASYIGIKATFLAQCGWSVKKLIFVFHKVFKSRVNSGSTVTILYLSTYALFIIFKSKSTFLPTSLTLMCTPLPVISANL